MRAALLTLTLLLSSAGGIRVLAPSGEQSIRSGQPLTLVFQLHNDTPTEWSGTPELELPQGWRALFPPEALHLLPGGDATLLLPVEAPAPAPAGSYAVRVNASGLQATATVRIPPRRNVTIRPEEGDTLALDGRVTATFLIRNDGNVPETLGFSAEPQALRAARPGATLAPGEQLRVTVAGVLPHHPSPSRRVTLRVQGQDGLSKVASVNRLQLRTEVPLEERSLTLKGRVRFSVQPQTSAELELSGQLGADLPGTFRLSASKSGWLASYRDQRVDFGVGYLSTTALPLQPAAKLFGVSAALRGQAWWSSASAGLQGDTFAGSVLLGRSGARSSVAVGLSTSEAGQTLAAEVAGHSGSLRGQISGALDLTSLAPRVQARLDHADRQTAVSLGAHYRAADFAGQPNAALTVSASLRSQLAAGVTGSLSGEYQVDPVTPGARAAFTVAGRLAHRSQSWGTYLRLAGGQATGSGLTFDSSRWHSSLAWTPATLTYQGSVTLPVASLASASLSLRPAITTTLNLGTPHLFTSVGLQASWNHPRGTASAGLTSPAFPGGPWTVAGNATAKVSGADVTVSVRSTLGTGQPHTRLSAAMSIPLNIATAPRADMGRIKGQVHYPDGRPLVGLRLRAGSLMAVSDAAGHFIFPSVPEGEVLLNLVNQDDAAGLRARPALPLKVTVRGGQASEVQVQLSPGATIQGRLNLRWPSSVETVGKLIVPEAPVASELTLRLSGPTASYESRISADGAFLLRHILLGTYEISLLGSGGKVLETALLTDPLLVVREERPMTVSLDLVPRTQEVRIDDGGELKLN